MKRLVLLAGALVVSSAAFAADETEMKANGEFRVRYYNDMAPSGIKDNPANTSDTEIRTKLGFNLRKGDSLQAHLDLMHGTLMGAANSLGGPTGYSTVNTNNSLLVKQAYGWWKASDALNFKVGRQYVEIADGSVFSTDDWNLSPTTHEGLKVGYDTDFANLGLYLIKLAEKGTATGNPDSDPEQNAYILSGDLKNMPEAIKTANVTVAMINKSETTAASGLNGTAGSMAAQHVSVALGGDVAGFNYAFDAAFQMGTYSKTAATDQKLSTSMFDLMVGYGMPETMGLKLWAGYHMDSGDDAAADDKNEQYVPLYYDSHKFAGKMDVFGWGNLSYFHLGASVAPADDTEVGLALYGFSKSKENGATPPASGNDRFTAFRAGAAATGKKDLGMELDVWAKKKYGPNFTIDAQLGAFMPGAAFKDATPKREATIMQLMIAGTMTF